MDPVGHRVLRQGHRIEKGVENPRLRRDHGPDAPHLGEERPQLGLVQQMQSPAAVGLPLGQETAEHRQVLLVKGHQEFSRLAVRDLQLAAQRRKALVALHTQLGHEAPRAVVEAGVDHGGVAAAGSGGHVGLLFHQGHRPLGTGQLPGNGTAHGAAADDEDIIGSV